MNEAIVFFWSVAVAFAVLLGLEWRYRLKTLRIGAAILAVVMLVFFQPNYHAAWRRAMGTPPSERITGYPGTSPGSVARPLSEYESGVFTMRRALSETVAGYARERELAVGVLLWLACSPAFRRVPGRAQEDRTRVHSGAGAAGA
jgi:hypothetical protein